MITKSNIYPVKLTVTITLGIVFVSFLLQALYPLVFTNWQILQGIKAFTAIFCLASLIFWLFLRNTSSYLYRDNSYKLKRVALILLSQFFCGVSYFVSKQPDVWQLASAANLLISGFIFVSLHRIFLYRRLSDVFVVFAVSSIFLALISFILGVNGDFYAWQEVPTEIYLVSLFGCVLMLMVGLLRAQYKLGSYSNFEFLPILIAITGLFEVLAISGNTMWWSAGLLQLIFVFSIYTILTEVNRGSSADWQMFKDGFDLSSHAYFCSEISGRVRFVNKAYLQLLEISEQTKTNDITHPLYTHPLADSVSKALEQKGHWSGETVLVTETGKVVSVLAEFTMTQFNGKAYQQAWFYDIHEKIELQQNESVILEKLERLSFSLMERQEEERRYFAKELHDEIGQSLTLLKIQLQLPEPDKDLITTVLSELIDKVRNLSLNLRPAILDDMGLSSALDWLSDRQRRFSQLAVTTEIDSKIPRLSDKVEISVFRIAQEAFTNIHKYSHADHVFVSCQIEGEYLQLILEDNGVGFDVDAKLNRANKGQSLGLLSIKERAFLVNGLVNIDSTPEQGTRIELRVPMQLNSQGEE